MSIKNFSLKIVIFNCGFSINKQTNKQKSLADFLRINQYSSQKKTTSSKQRFKGHCCKSGTALLKTESHFEKKTVPLSVYTS